MSAIPQHKDPSDTDVFAALAESHITIVKDADPSGPESRLEELANSNGDPEFDKKIKKLRKKKVGCKKKLCRRLHGSNGQHV
jgi:hypothetical protein